MTTIARTCIYIIGDQVHQPMYAIRYIFSREKNTYDRTPQGCFISASNLMDAIHVCTVIHYLCIPEQNQIRTACLIRWATVVLVKSHDRTSHAVWDLFHQLQTEPLASICYNLPSWSIKLAVPTCHTCPNVDWLRYIN